MKKKWVNGLNRLSVDFDLEPIPEEIPECTPQKGAKLPRDRPWTPVIEPITSAPDDPGSGMEQSTGERNRRCHSHGSWDAGGATSCDLVNIQIGSDRGGRRTPRTDVDAAGLAYRAIRQPHSVAPEALAVVEAGAATKAQGLLERHRVHSLTVIDQFDAKVSALSLGLRLDKN